MKGYMGRIQFENVKTKALIKLDVQRILLWILRENCFGVTFNFIFKRAERICVPDLGEVNFASRSHLLGLTINLSTNLRK